MTDLTRDKPAAATTPLARLIAVVSFVLAVSGVLFWVPALFLPPPQAVSHDWITFIQRVANVALQQYTPNMRAVVPVLGALFTLVSLVQIPASVGAWIGHSRALSILRIIAYVKIGLFVTSCLLLGLAVFSVMDPANPPWTLTAASWVSSFLFIGIYVWMIRAINGILGDHMDPGSVLEDEEEEDEDGF